MQLNSFAKTNRQVRNPEMTKKQILDAAEEEFARYGLSGTRIEEIAKGAGVTTGMIYYYFINKEELYKNVLQTPIAELHEELEQLNLDCLQAEEALKSIVQVYIAYAASHNKRGMILFQELVQNQGKYLEQMNWQNTFVYIINVLKRGIAEGSFRQLNPILTTIQIFSICVFYFTFHENLKRLTPNLQLLSPEIIEQYTQEVIKLFLLAFADHANFSQHQQI
ncbi:TetR/AcrR family transcriptional regulator [Pelatocladus sp. BLCC-F211]|uniref:TetR/AcrR family transcriptional regulator n=1 Tax=Pelatocladus sp. BLCC-F211 TaxID=3342752 RepID=UPI0035BAF838